MIDQDEVSKCLDQIETHFDVLKKAGRLPTGLELHFGFLFQTARAFCKAREVVEAARGMFTVKSLYGFTEKFGIMNHPHTRDWHSEYMKLKNAMEKYDSEMKT